MELSFIIIDDSDLDHFIVKKMIGNIDKTLSTLSFFDANLALEHIRGDGIAAGIKITIIFLDIYMPMMDGFQFFEEFEKLDQAIQDKYYIVVLTSSREISDIRRIRSYKPFKAILNKPITSAGLASLLDKVTKEYNVQ